MEKSELDDINRAQIHQAGPRYTPGIKPDAPNIEIFRVMEAFDGLAYSDALEDRLLNLAGELLEEWNKAPDATRAAFNDRKQTPERIVELLRSISNRRPTDNQKELQQLTRATRYAKRRINEVGEELRSQQHQAEDKQRRRELNNVLADHRRLSREIDNVSEFVEGPVHSLLREKTLFLKGEWGTGKTHFLCDLTEIRMENDLPTLFILAETLPDDVPPLEGICQVLDSTSTPHQLLSGLQALGEDSGGRALLFIDGINEADREQWKTELAPLAKQVKEYPHVGIGISCRTPFDKEIVTSSAKSHTVQVEHRGFEESEFDAQVEFFDYYDIPTPHVPLLTPEFSRPLFLKILCEAITRSNQNNQQEYLMSIASGQRGMTDILEHFARVIGEDIENDFELERKTCWKILKGTSTGTTQRSGFAGTMADESRDFLTKQEARGAIREESNLSHEEADDLLDRMVSDGLLAETLHRNQTTTEVVRFPYQRFGDHIISRHLLAEHLNTDTEETIRRSFYVNRPLGQIFELVGGDHRFAQPGLAAAIMIEFPQRVKRVLPQEERELVFYIPKKRRYGEPIKDVFLDGLYWRNAESFTDQTNDIINFFLDQPDDWVQEKTLEVLVGLASRPGHPYDAERLYQYLYDMDMPDRDEHWSEYLRNVSKEWVVPRILQWLKNAAIDEFPERTAQNTVQLLSTFLTTTDRHLRDQVTKALYRIGLSHPETLFKETRQSLSFDDIYVPERMMASCYGVTMSLWADPNGDTVRSSVPDFATKLIVDLFEETSDYSTKHILIRQYARGIIELADKIDNDCLSREQIELANPPLDHIDSPFKDPATIDDNELEDVEPAFHMDFSNYTVGKLVPERGNYEDSHPEYQAIFRQIKKRVKDLGYSHNRFQPIDEQISRRDTSRSRNGTKTDRYGKKYSWIAFFEMYGQRVDQGILPTRKDEVHPTDSDIDPSFPEEPPKWHPDIPDLFPTDNISDGDWISNGPDPNYEHLLVKDSVDGIEGPWALLDGYIEQESTDSLRVFTFLRGVIVDETVVPELTRRLEKIEYPGNWKIPDPNKDHYTFAGEIPWSDRFGPYLRENDGAAKRNIKEAFRTRTETNSNGISVEIPDHTYSWERYHSQLNQYSGMRFPAPALCQHLNLVNHSQSLDLFDLENERATIYREFHGQNATFDSWLLYIRKDLLDRYLGDIERTIAWAPWGERTLSHGNLQSVPDEISDRFNRYEHIHKDVIRYE